MSCFFPEIGETFAEDSFAERRIFSNASIYTIYFISFLRNPSCILDIQNQDKASGDTSVEHIQISQIDHWHGVDTLTGLKCRSNWFKARLGRLLQVMKNGTENGKKCPHSTRSALLDFPHITQCQLPSFQPNLCHVVIRAQISKKNKTFISIFS